MHFDWLSTYDNKWHGLIRLATIDTTVFKTAIQYFIIHQIYIKHSTITKKSQEKYTFGSITYCTKINVYVDNDSFYCPYIFKIELYWQDVALYDINST